MPYVKLNGATMWYEESGAGSETLVFGHGLAFTGSMFEAQVAELRARYRCITFDLRGHGKSELTETGYDMDTLAGDASALIEHLECGPCHFVGWSVSGFTGLRNAARKPHLFRSLTLIGSASIRGSDTSFLFKLVPFLARALGMGFICGELMKLMFSAGFLTDPGRAVERARWRDGVLAAHALGVSRTAWGVVRQKSIDAELRDIRVPVLMIRGEVDAIIHPAFARSTIDAIAGGQWRVIPKTGHACHLEAPQVVNAALTTFFERVGEGPR